MSPLDLELLTRPGCHLCEDVEALLGGLAAEIPLTVRSVDIDADPLLRRRYGLRIPVVRSGGRDLCEGRISEAMLRDALTAVAA